MLDMNMIIARNIVAQLKKNNKKQVELAAGIGISKSAINKILSGARMVNAIELHQIAEYFGIKMEELLECPDNSEEINVVRAFMGKVSSVEAKEALAIADELADMILFHARVRENSEAMMETWEI